MLFGNDFCEANKLWCVCLKMLAMPRTSNQTKVLQTTTNFNAHLHFVCQEVEVFLKESNYLAMLMALTVSEDISSIKIDTLWPLAKIHSFVHSFVLLEHQLCVLYCECIFFVDYNFIQFIVFKSLQPNGIWIDHMQYLNNGFDIIT